ncbi:MAG: hypothetical protein GY862_16830 [Gammaproteobacteria bacterium]|nr:hypothetical protein [Gammaproteobacteria bacterium]
MSDGTGTEWEWDVDDEVETGRGTVLLTKRLSQSLKANDPKSPDWYGMAVGGILKIGETIDSHAGSILILKVYQNDIDEDNDADWMGLEDPDSPALSTHPAQLPILSSREGEDVAKPQDPVGIVENSVIQEELEAADFFTSRAKATATLDAYEKDWKAFKAWASARNATPLPASGSTVAVHLAAFAKDGAGVSTVGRRLAAIRFMHEQNGETPPYAAAIKQVMSGIRRVKGNKPRKVKALTPDLLLQVLPDPPRDEDGALQVDQLLRDRALLLTGFGGAFRRSELSAMDVEHVDFRLEQDADKGGMVITLPRSKGDQEARGRTVRIPVGSTPDVCPVRTLKDWIDTAELLEGPLFPRFSGLKDLLRPSRRLGPASVARLVKKYTAEAGLEPSDFSGHSLRRGWMTGASYETGRAHGFQG